MDEYEVNKQFTDQYPKCTAQERIISFQ